MGVLAASLVGIEVQNYRQLIVGKYHKQIDGKDYLIEKQKNGNKIIYIENDGKYVGIDEYFDENARAQKDELVKKLEDK